MNSSEYVPVEELKAADDPRWHALLNGKWVSDESEEEFRERAVGAVEQHIAGQREIVTVNETSHLRGTGLPMGLFQRS